MSPHYMIPLSGLKEGRHEFDFEIDNRFFEKFEESEIREGSLIADVIIEKRSTHAELEFRIKGTVSISCDRCLDKFLYPIDSLNRLLVKFSVKDKENDPDILYLPSGENEIDLNQHLYDFILLALPIRRIHPDDEQGNSTCNPAMLKKLDDLKADEGSQTDPRWDELKKLIDNN